MIYFDGTHLMADTLDELHAEAYYIGLERKWFQDHPRHPHYDVWGAPKKLLTANRTTREMLKERKVVTQLADSLGCSKQDAQARIDAVKG